MKTEEKLQRLLEMQAHPERYTEEQIRQLMADDECRQFYEQMVRAADAEFAEAIVPPKVGKGTAVYKLAVAFVGLLMLSGITYAGVHFARQHQRQEVPQVADTAAVANSSRFLLHSSLPADTATVLPRLYDNVPLGEILDELSTYYPIKVVYRTVEARQPRLYYQWKPEYTIEKVVKMLNNFEWLELELENDTLYVKSTAIAAHDC